MNLKQFVIPLTSLFIVILFNIQVQGVKAQQQVQDIDLKKECRDNWKQGDSYLIGHPTDCSKYISCRPLHGRDVAAILMKCPFGAHWRRGAEESCDLIELANCANDPCRKNGTLSYDYEDDKCRTYYKCVNRQSVAECCNKYHSYNVNTGQCERNATCTKCGPLRPEDTCQNKNITALDIPDNNCKTYNMCDKKGNATPTCCPRREGFNVFTSMCDPKITCDDHCDTASKTESCLSHDVPSHEKSDQNCRTYVRCQNGRSIDYCCNKGRTYDSATRTCVKAKDHFCKNAVCPKGHEGGTCLLFEIAGNPAAYNNTMDPNTWTPMNCPRTLIFYPDKCGCDYDTSITKSPVVTGCPIHIRMLANDTTTPPTLPLKNNGTEPASLQVLGQHDEALSTRGRMTAEWKGADGVLIPYYANQDIYEVSLLVRFTLQRFPASLFKQVLLSSCRNFGGVPSLEVNFHRNNSMPNPLRLNIVAKQNGASHADMSMPVEVNVPYQLRVLFDRYHIGVFLDREATPAVATIVEKQQFKGPIWMSYSGLRFASCDNSASNFKGNIKEIQFSKCLPSDLKAMLNNQPN